jgi:hypothetical protein
MRNRMFTGAIVVASVCAIVLTGVVTPSAVAASLDSREAHASAVTYHERDYLRFQHALQRIELLLTGQSLRLELANLSVTQTQEWIAQLQSEGKDTSDLDASVSTFQGQISVAQGAHNNAQSIIDAKAGFDANGMVVDEEQARQTLEDARDAMRECRDAIQPAAQTFREAIRAFIESHRPAAQPQDLEVEIVG